MKAINYVKKLEVTGFTREQAEVSINILNDTIQTLATKQDLQNTTGILRSEVHALGTELRSEMQLLGAEVRADLRKELQDETSKLRAEMTAMKEENQKEHAGIHVALEAMERNLSEKMYKLMGGGIATLGVLMGLIEKFL